MFMYSDWWSQFCQCEMFTSQKVRRVPFLFEKCSFCREKNLNPQFILDTTQDIFVFVIFQFFLLERLEVILGIWFTASTMGLVISPWKKPSIFWRSKKPKVKSCGTSKSPRNGGDEKVPGNGGNGGENPKSGWWWKVRHYNQPRTKM